MAAVGLVATGCGSSSSSSGGSASSGGGCSDLEIGVMGPMTGTFASYGQTALHAAQLKMKPFLAQHPKCHIKLVQFDPQGDPKQGPGLARKAISDQKMVAILGPAFSGVTQAVTPILDAAGMPMITGTSTNGELSQSGWKVFHRTVVNDSQEGPTEAKYLVDNLHLKKVAVVDNGQTYGKGLADLVRKELKQLGGQVVDSESIDANGSDYSSTINRIRAANPQVVYCGCLDPEAARLVKQLRAAGDKTTFTGGAGLNTNQYLKEAGKAVNGSQVGSGGIDAQSSPQGKAWLASWKQMFNGPPDLYAVEWTNAAQALYNAIGSGHTTRESIQQYLGTASFPGAAGDTVAFTAQGDVKNGKLNWYVVKNQQFELVNSIPLITLGG
jgi:branched-chain amino acid transport system substrate-binding protein